MPPGSLGLGEPHITVLGCCALWTWLLALSALGCHETGPQRDDWLIAPGRGVGRVDAATTERGLIGAYGAAAVTPARIELGEGETAPGTILYPTDSLRRLEILWQDTVSRARLARVIVRGSAGVWHLPAGIGLGTRLSQLERYNRKPFTLAGFGWDYGGVVLDWRGGTLAGLLPGVRLYLDPASDRRASPAYREVLGDHDYPSDGAPMQALDPAIYQIFVDFDVSPQ